jgi:glutamate N-acetyltransferase / amino-acid N-acetyltransferase
MSIQSIIENDTGGVTSPRGFKSGAVRCGIKRSGEFDLGILFSEVPCNAAGVFTKNLIKSAPVVLSQKNLGSGSCQAVIVNSGCANACTAEGGYEDAKKMMQLTAQKLGISTESVTIAATGVIGVRLPMDKITSGIKEISFSEDDSESFARSIMTTDTFIKQHSVDVMFDKSTKYTIGGVCKGAGMIHPNMATMLCFITTDANVEISFLRKALKQAADKSFNLVTVDGDTSPSDTVIVLANGKAGNKVIDEKNGSNFKKALKNLCIRLAKDIARDGEGATKLIEVSIESARTIKEARMAARTVANSPLVKAAMYGNDPNWGRIIVAIGRSGAMIVEDKIELYLNNICVMKRGAPAGFDVRELSASLADASNGVKIQAILNIGKAGATAWGCDLTKEYVTINSAYTT